MFPEGNKLREREKLPVNPRTVIIITLYPVKCLLTARTLLIFSDVCHARLGTWFRKFILKYWQGQLWFQVWKEIFWNVCFLWCWKSFGCSGIVPTIFPVRPVSVISKFLVLEQNKAKLALSISTIMKWEINGLSIWNLKLITQLWSWGGRYCVFECACALSLELSLV